MQGHEILALLKDPDARTTEVAKCYSVSQGSGDTAPAPACL